MTEPEADFPELAWDDWFAFPDPVLATPEGIVGAGGNLSPGMLLSAYRQGCFPWYSPGEPILWWNPDPRFVLFPEALHQSDSLRRFRRKTDYQVSFDQDFAAVIGHCQQVPRPGQSGTWITPEVVRGYRQLFDLGFAHSVEVWQPEAGGRRLVGGLYGIQLGQVFFGESMFSLAPNASKVGFVTVVDYLRTVHQVRLIDCQAPTAYLTSFGAQSLARSDFLAALDRWVVFPGPRQRWSC